jgi:hypothetical protein
MTVKNGEDCKPWFRTACKFQQELNRNLRPNKTLHFAACESELAQCFGELGASKERNTRGGEPDAPSPGD